MHLETLPEEWDLIVVGGGITGAGILREAARMNLRVLLLEQKDFAWENLIDQYDDVLEELTRFHP